MKKILKITALTLTTLILGVLLLIHFKVFWVLAPYYTLTQSIELEVPIMDMKAYEEIWNTHRRPYIYTLSSRSGGAALIMGIIHTKEADHPHLDSLKYHWEAFDADIALVEGRVGNLITWFQDPTEELGEGGLVTHLANQKGINVYSWESRREDEIRQLLEKHTPEEIAMFYTFRPYFSNMRYGEYSDPEAALQDYVESRTDYPGIEGVFTSWEELDKKWKTDYPNIEWRTYGSGKGYPEGYLHDIWNATNVMRDEHMVKAIAELVDKGHRVFITMGASHAPRIEATLRALLGTAQ